MLMKKLEILARERGYTLSRKGREITWTRNDDDKVCGVSSCVSDAYEDINEDYKLRLKTNYTSTSIL